MKQPAFRYKHILIIDDSRMDILILKEILKSINFAEHIITFENPIHALNYLKRCDEFPELIFIDLVMPGIGGYQFIDRFKRDFLQNLNFVVISASDDPSDLEESSLYNNIVGYFKKPVNKLDLINLEE